jgi:hypothetical protein
MMASKTKTAAEVVVTQAAGGGPADPVADAASAAEIAANARQNRQQRQARQQERRSGSGLLAPRRNYQGIILAEYIAVVALIALTPIATKQNQDSPGLSPYAGKDIVRLASLTLLYLMLGLLSVGGRGPGRVAAWLGGLFLITEGLYEASNLVKDFGLFTGALSAAASTSGGGTPAGTSTSPTSTPGTTETGGVATGETGGGPSGRSFLIS